jgi:ABC-type polysaccharide/polyol phosphate transport system ATPase subunit
MIAPRGPTALPRIEASGLDKVFDLPVKVGKLKPAQIGRVLLGIAGLGGGARDVTRAIGREPVAALSDVTFHVPPGEIVCLQGPARAGKTTLLRILSGSLPPTAGKAVLRGRVGALIDIKDAIERHLSVRQSIRKELATASRDRKAGSEAEIVALAGLEGFENAPSGKLSSGMQMRLCVAQLFASQPDIIFMDDILGTGDVAFRRHCIRQLRQLREAGSSALIVPPDEAFAEELGARILAISDGRLIDFEGVDDDDPSSCPGLTLSVPAPLAEGVVATLEFVHAGPAAAEEEEDGRVDLSIRLKEAQVYRPLVDVMAQSGVVVMRSVSPSPSRCVAPETVSCSVSLPLRYLADGDYSLNFFLVSQVGDQQHVLRAPGAVLVRVAGRGKRAGPVINTGFAWHLDQMQSLEFSQ